MPLQFTIPEMHAYMAEVFPELGARFEVLALEPFRLTARMTTAAGDLRPGGTVSGPAIFALADCAFYMATLAMIGRAGAGGDHELRHRLHAQAGAGRPDRGGARS